MIEVRKELRFFFFSMVLDGIRRWNFFFVGKIYNKNKRMDPILHIFAKFLISNTF